MLATRILVSLLALSAPVTATAAELSATAADTRVQIVSDNLVRIERRGPNGFEDRPTFHVLTRNFGGEPKPTWRVTESPDQPVEIVASDGKLLYRDDGQPTASQWLPGPSDLPAAWAFADSPRIVPPPWGATPAPEGSPHANTSGWDLTNPARDVYVFIPDGDYRAFRQAFINLTGRTEMPPLYAFAYMDSRYHAYTAETALQQIDDYRSHDIPLDVLVIDTDWRIGASHGYQPSPDHFPDMPAFLSAAKGKNVRIMFNDHPEPQEKAALDPSEMKYRYDGLTTLLRQGVDVWWYDRNWHVGLVEPAPGLRKEVWGMRLYHDITASVRPDQRPLIMANVDGIDNGRRNRAPNVAAHRYPIQWTGDTQFSMQYLRWGVENAVFSGVHALNPYMSEDLGGHVGNPTPEGYIRWLQYGALSPVCRVHCTKGPARMPWTFGEQAEAITREYVKMRYRLLPVFYAAAHENYETGQPLLRRCDLYWPAHTDAKRDDQYLLGDDILVAPVMESRTDNAPVPAEWLSHDGQPGLKAEMFDGTELKGPPLLTRVDPKIDFWWDQRSPADNIKPDHFSIRWTGQLTTPADGKQTLAVRSDDGVRLWIDDRLVVDAWKPLDSVTNSAEVALEPGRTYNVRLEYMELEGGARCQLLHTLTDPPPLQRELWIPPGTWIDAWTGEQLAGPKVIRRPVTLRETPMYIRAGAIIPLAPEMQFIGEKAWDPITLDIYPGDSGRCTIYEDDGTSIAYQTGAFRKTQISTTWNAGQLAGQNRPGRGRLRRRSEAAFLPPAYP